MSSYTHIKISTKNLLAILLAKAVIITALINFYMVSILPNDSESHLFSIEENSTSVTEIFGDSSSIKKEHDMQRIDNNTSNTVDTSWACVQHSADTHIHERRLSIKENSETIRDGFHDTVYRPIKYEPVHSIQEVRDRSRGVLRKVTEEHHKPLSVGDTCELYSCVSKNGSFFKTEGKVGYAGKFVHRDKDVRKQLMYKPGGKSWASGCVVSHKYKFIYIHVLKSGGTATKEFIRKSLCGEDDKDCKKVDREIVKPYNCKSALRENADYFTFSFVRNPFSRIYSMYSMMDGFPVSPSLRGHVTETLPFQRFVKLTPKERKKYTKMHASHYFSQSDFIFSRGGCPSFDFLGRVEHFDEDMRTILEHLNAKEMINYLDKKGGVQPANTWGSSKKKSTGGDLRKEYTSQEVVSAVATTYNQDFQLLGYNKDEVPIN